MSCTASNRASGLIHVNSETSRLTAASTMAQNDAMAGDTGSTRVSGNPVAPAGGRVGATPYGYVDEEAREYVVTRPDTPTPWINYLGEGRYGGIVSNTGGGYSFDRDPRDRRVSRYRYNGIPADQPGRYVYLRDQETGAFWSVTWQPVRREPGRLRVSPRRRLHAHRDRARRDRVRAPLLRPVGRRRAAVRALGPARPQRRRAAAPAAQLQLRRARLSGRRRRPAEPRLGAAHRAQPLRERRRS